MTSAPEAAFDVNEIHFHVCAACFHIWNHSPAASMIAGKKAHCCPECSAGPFRDGWKSYRAAHAEMVRLKTLGPARPFVHGETVSIIDSRGDVVGTERVKRAGKKVIVTKCGRRWRASDGLWIGED